MAHRIVCGILTGTLALLLSACGPTEEGPTCNEDTVCGCYGVWNEVMLYCECTTGYAGDYCDECANGFVGYPDCVLEGSVDDPYPEGDGDSDSDLSPDDSDAAPDGDADTDSDTDTDVSTDCPQCNGNGKCQPDGSCKCYQGYIGMYCDECSPGYTGYPDCYFKMCEPNALACKGTTVVQQCDSLGKEWTEVETCTEGTTCFKGACMTECQLAEAQESYVGCEYWGAYLQNLQEFDGGNYAVVVANPNDTDVTVMVYGAGDSLLSQFTVAPGQINSAALDLSHMIGGAGISNLGLKIVASRPVTMTQMNPFGNVLIYTNDATLLLPIGALGQKNMAMSWPTWSDGYPGFISVVAAEAGTTTLTVIYGGFSAGGSGVNAQNPGDSVTYTLNQYQILTLNSASGGSYGADLSGTYIAADKKVAVFGGHICTDVPADKTACDHLEHQMFPLRSWGKDYVAVRTMPRGSEADYFRFLASQDNTVINWTGGVSGSVTLNAGQRHEIATTADFVVTADKPILVSQTLASQDAGAGTGDPAMMLVAPSEQLRKDYIFLVAPNYDYDRLTIVSQAGNQITLDGTVMNSDTFTPIPGTIWYRQYIETAEGAHTLTATKPVGLYVYGFSQYVSYAYTAGLDLLKINDQD